MKKNITSIFFTLLIIVGFSGCMEEKVSCKDKFTQIVIGQMVSPNIQILTITKELYNVKPALAFGYFSAYNMLKITGNENSLLEDNSRNDEDLKAIKSKVKEEFKNADLLLNSIKTISKDKDKIVCSANVKADTLSYKSNYVVTYNIQYQNGNYSYELENIE